MTDTPKSTFRTLLAGPRGLWLVNLANLGDGIAYFGVLGLMTLFLQKNLGLATQSASIAVSVFTGLVTVFMTLGAGSLSDRLGVRRAIAVSLAAILLGRALFTLSPSLGTSALAGAWAGIVVVAFGEGLLQPSLYAGAKQYSDKQSAAMSYAMLYAIMNLGIVLGEIVSPFVRAAWATRVEGADVHSDPTAGITGAFWFFTLVTAAFLALHLAFFRKSMDVPRGPAEPTRPFLERLKSLPLLDARFMAFIFMLYPVRTMFAHQWLTVPDYVTRCFDSSVGAKLEWINGLNPLIIVFAVPACAALTRRWNIITVMLVGTLVSAGATFMLVGPPSLTMLLAYVVVFSAGEAIWSSRYYEFIAELAPDNRVGAYMGLAGIPWFLAKTATGLYAGAAVDRFVPADGPQSPGTLWLIHGAFAMLSPILLLALRGWLGSGRTVEPSTATRV